MSGGEREYEGSEYERDDYESAREQAEIDEMVGVWWNKLLDGKVHPENAELIRTNEAFCKWFFRMGFIAAGCEASERDKQKNALPEMLQKKLQSLMYYLTKEAARTSYREFLEFLDINEGEYAKIKAIWKDRLGVKPYV